MQNHQNHHRRRRIGCTGSTFGRTLRLILVNPAYSLIRLCRFCICAKQWSCHRHAKCHAISVRSGTRTDEKMYPYENSIYLNFIKTRLGFPVDDYDLWFRPNMNSLVLFIKDFVRCRRLGIPVLKLEPLLIIGSQSTYAPPPL